MDIVYLSQQDLEKMSIFYHGNFSSEGIIYYNQEDGYLYKVINNNFLYVYNRVNLLKCIPSFDYIKAIGCLTNGLIVIKMENLVNYQTLFESLYLKEISFFERINLSIQLISIIKKIHLIGYTHDDINVHNVMSDKSDIKLIDAVSGTIKEEVDSLSFYKNMYYDILNANTVTLSLIYKVDMESIIYKKGLNFLMEFIKYSKMPNNLKNYLFKIYGKKENEEESEIVLLLLILIWYFRYNKKNLDNQRIEYIDQFLLNGDLNEQLIKNDAKILQHII